MSTCVKVIFRQLPDGMVDVRVGFDETPDATDVERMFAKGYAERLTDHFRRIPGSRDIRREEGQNA